MLLSKYFRALLSLPITRAVVAFFILYTSARLYAMRSFWRNPHSWFHDPTHAYELQYSALRAAQANTYIDTTSHSSSFLPKAGTKPEICAAFVTVQREKRNYIEEALGSMFEGLSQQEREKLYTCVLFSNPDPSRHDSWASTLNGGWIEKSVDKVGSYNVSSKIMAHLRQLEIDKGFQEKGIFDYIYAMETYYATETPYILLLEDDILLSSTWLSKTLSALHSISHSSSPGQKFHNWIYLRLFYTETFLTWEKEDFWWTNYRLTYILSGITTATILLLSRYWSTKTKRNVDYWTIAMLALLTPWYFVDLAFKSGTYSLFPLHDIFIMNKYGCCSQALLFPRHQIPELANFLRDKIGQTDSFIEEYAEGNRFTRLAIANPLVQHVGLESSRGSTEEVAKSIWAFQFEGFSEGGLGREHERLLKDKRLWVEETSTIISDEVEELGLGF